MQLIITANELQKEELSLKKVNPGVDVIFLEDAEQLYDYNNADAFLILNKVIKEPDLERIGNKTVFVNSVSVTLGMLDMPKNVCRVNGWRTFLNNDVWEVAATDHQAVKELFSRIGWKCILVADEPGLVSARVISMIINEAYFALGDEVSSKNEIDTAMKLGTNYPYGPFEWSERIGLINIHTLLLTLRQDNKCYEIAPALEKELALIS